MLLDDLYTPCLIVDKQKLTANIDRMNARSKKLGVSFRPHVKTTKCIPIALLINDGMVGPITVSTLREAEYFADAGFKDIIYAVSIVPSKLPRVNALLERGVDLKLLIDDLGVAMELNDYDLNIDGKYRVLIEIDVDMHRAGKSSDDPTVIEIARILHEGQNSEFCGVLTHAGESYTCSSEEELINAAEDERALIVMAAQNIRAAGIPCNIVSCGSTPTATFAKNLGGVTELRAGVYVFQDLFQSGRNVCEKDELALTVLTTVISHKTNQNRIITDAGGMALSKDQSTHGTNFDCGYGLVSDLDGKIIENLFVKGANQEHGIITTQDGSKIDYDRFHIGTKLRIFPNHACMTAAAYESYNIINQKENKLEIWYRCNGW